MSFRISKLPVAYFPESGEISRMNPIPERAVETKAGSGGPVGRSSGVGRIDYEYVLSMSSKEVSAFKESMGLKGSLLAGNTKTNKERVESGKVGVIKGLSLTPHFYPNFLNKAPLIKGTERLAYVNKHDFNTFDGRTQEGAAESSGVAKRDLLTFCTHSSEYCRASCLIFTGQNPLTREAANSKVKNTYAFLYDPESFVGLLRSNIISFAKSTVKDGKDPVIRLNMLSDIPWYEICPELLVEMAEDYGVVWYDYTKTPFWNNPAYRQVEDILDLTFSFAGNNEKLCERALNAGYRVATVFAPANPERRAGVQTRTSFQEVSFLARRAGLLSEDGYLKMFGGEWEFVDGDSSDYRIDDPAASIVCLNFKEPSVSTKGAEGERYKRLWEAIPEARAKFSRQMPDEDRQGELYAEAIRSKNFLRFLAEISDYAPDDKIGKDLLEDIDAEDLLEIYRDYLESDYKPSRSARKNPLALYQEGDPSEPMDENTHVAMFPVENTGLLIGPHVPTLLDD